MKPLARSRGVNLRIGKTSRAELRAELAVPGGALGTVVLAGAGAVESNRPVADRLERAGFATLLVDLVDGEERAEDEYTGQHRFDLERLAGRVRAAIGFIASEPELGELPVGVFARSSDAPAALVAAAEEHESVAAVVCVDGRLDLALETLSGVSAPTQLIVSEGDRELVAMNRTAYDELKVEKDLVLLPDVDADGAETATGWFTTYLAPAG